MASEALVFPQNPFGCACAMKELLGNGDGGGWNFIYDGFGDQEEKPVDDGVVNHGEWDVGLPWPSSPVATTQHGGGGEEKSEVAAPEAAGRKKRRRSSTQSCKNEEEVENQRRTHIVVERNRRMLMNEYLTVLRSIMPQSYVQRGDQASIVGGAINFVKELEQLLQSLEAQRRLKLTTHPAEGTSTPFSDFFTSPQYSTSSQSTSITAPTTTTTTDIANETIAKNHSAAADIEVTMVESHATLKVLSRRRRRRKRQRQPNQLLNMVVGLQNLRLTTLHLNVTTVEQMVLYSFSLKVEDDCHLTAADDIATAVYDLVGKIQAAGVI